MNLIEHEYIQEYARQLYKLPIRFPTPPEDHEAEIAICDSALALNPPNDWATAFLGARGMAYHWLGRSEEALRDLTEVIRLKPGNSFDYEFRSWIYKKMGNLEAARADHKMFHRLEEQE